MGRSQDARRSPEPLNNRYLSPLTPPSAPSIPSREAGSFFGQVGTLRLTRCNVRDGQDGPFADTAEGPLLKPKRTSGLCDSCHQRRLLRKVATRTRYGASDDPIRVICDHIAGMTDGFLLRSYERLFSPRMGSVFDRI